MKNLGFDSVAHAVDLQKNGSQPPASPVSSIASSAVTAREEDDAVSVESDFFSDAASALVSVDEGAAAVDWLPVLDEAAPPTTAAHADQAAADQVAAGGQDADAHQAADDRAAASTLAVPMPGNDQTSEPQSSRLLGAAAVSGNSETAPAADDAPPLATLSVFAHNATSFRCIACAFAAPQIADLHAHSCRQHRGTTFTDVFHGGCACAASFAQRAAATRHSLRCGTAPSALGAARPTQQPAPADTEAAGGGPTVTCRFLTTNASPTEATAPLSGNKRRRLHPPAASTPTQDGDMELRATDAASACKALGSAPALSPSCIAL
ncbi:hypothetical protein PHYSODRAFT_332487 [Phytophthora sojae]|uniref:C2H2-type domain-containing protein n=1 Tax=Phytophthora sojae (strain P6497) TaxID=1094619 RepID=G4ZIA6_PHYSP|nr:hypothetical protein PHYSODRAFT_332487 [Phytophthora sojae]EGZ18743.1 hypothetical protein PHYSODRAFT_332487 [Phytophthora sojae]|eukprot:XP_009527801.1 hypothetical protein PHYSODRAFT_332487 [Phytophthora sojae]